MQGPLVFIATNRLKPGRLDSERARVPGLVEFVEANEPRVIAFNEYVNEAGDEVSVVQIHPDAASMEAHIAIVTRGDLRPSGCCAIAQSRLVRERASRVRRHRGRLLRHSSRARRAQRPGRLRDTQLVEGRSVVAVNVTVPLKFR